MEGDETERQTASEGVLRASHSDAVCVAFMALV